MKLGVTTTNGNRKIRTKVFAGVAHAVECACCCYLEVRSVTASLSHVGYLPFTCEDENPPDTDTRYLKYRATGDGYLEACGVAPQHQNVTQEWTVDPFTGLTCYNGPESGIVSSGCSELQNCSDTQKSYSCAFEGDPNDPCAPTEGGSINWTESLQDSYTIEDVASNVDTVLGRINPYGNDGMPAGTRGSVINGTNGSILTWVNDCALNRAEYTSGSGGVTKTKLFVKFTKATQYTLTQSNGSVQTLPATVGQEITVDPPSDPNTWTDIAIVNKTKVGCCNTSIGATTHTGQTTNETFVPDEEEDQPPSPTPFIGPDCKQYSTRTIATATNCSFTSTWTDNTGGGEGCAYGFDENQSATSSSNTTDTTNIWGISNNTTSNSGSGSFSKTETISCPGGSFEGLEFPPYNYTFSEQCTSTASNGIGTTICTSTTTVNGESETGNYSFDFYGGCSPHPNLGECGCPIIENTSISTTCISHLVSENPRGNSTQVDESTQITTITTTYSGEITSQDQLQNGTWEDEDPEDNESLCASRSESLTTKQSKDVDAEIELTFTAPASENPITYEHWFHYYTIEADNSEQGCPTSEVVAHNEKWTSVSSGGVLNLSRNINLSTPPKDHSICAQGLAFVTRVAS